MARQCENETMQPEIPACSGKNCSKNRKCHNIKVFAGGTGGVWGVLCLQCQAQAGPELLQPGQTWEWGSQPGDLGPQDQRDTEQFGMEGTLQLILLQTPSSRAEQTFPDRNCARAKDAVKGPQKHTWQCVNSTIFSVFCPCVLCHPGNLPSLQSRARAAQSSAFPILRVKAKKGL